MFWVSSTLEPTSACSAPASGAASFVSVSFSLSPAALSILSSSGVLGVSSFKTVAVVKLVSWVSWESGSGGSRSRSASVSVGCEMHSEASCPAVPLPPGVSSNTGFASPVAFFSVAFSSLGIGPTLSLLSSSSALDSWGLSSFSGLSSSLGLSSAFCSAGFSS